MVIIYVFFPVGASITLHVCTLLFASYDRACSSPNLDAHDARAQPHIHVCTHILTMNRFVLFASSASSNAHADDKELRVMLFRREWKLCSPDTFSARGNATPVKEVLRLALLSFDKASRWPLQLCNSPE